MELLSVLLVAAEIFKNMSRGYHGREKTDNHSNLTAQIFPTKGNQVYNADKV